MDLTPPVQHAARPPRPAQQPERTPLRLSTRDQQIVDTVARLGAAPTATLQALHSPHTTHSNMSRRLRQLCDHRLLRLSRHGGPVRNIWLYTIGPAALTPGQPRPWHPPLAQLQHTVAIGDALVALLRPTAAPGLLVTEWQGEAELRAWEQPGHPRPDLRVRWVANADADSPAGQRRGGWLDVEVDRGTEGRGAWRRKLARYLTYTSTAQILTVTTTDVRARSIAETAHAVGMRLLALSEADLLAGGDPLVYDAGVRRRHPLTAALLDAPDDTGGG
jgi:hypothetical protein